ncbi:MAG: hypothetical protein ACSHWU_01000 [Marinicella sp.]
MKAVSVIILVVLTWSASGQYLTPLIKEQIEGRYVGSSIMTESKLIYQTLKDESYSLWSMELKTKVKEKIYTGINNNSVGSPFLFNGLVYFFARNENYESNLWRTDGTASQTQLVSNEPIRGMRIKDNQMFFVNQQNRLSQFKNNTIVELPFITSSLNHICVFGEDNLIVQTNSEADDTYTFKRLNNGVITNVYQYKAVNNYQANFTLFKDNCFFQYYDYEDGLKVIQIPLQGHTKEFAVHDDIPPIKRVFTHLNRLYVVAGTGYNKNRIYRLTPDLFSYDATTTISDRYLFGTPRSQNDLMVSVVTQNQYEPFSLYMVLDADLNIIPHHYGFYQVPYGGPAVVGSDLLLATNTFHEDVVLERFKPNGGLDILSIKDHFIYRIISNSDDFYLVLGNDTLGSTNIYALTDKPNITPKINGNWIEPDIINQGLVVQQGQRQNGSEYAFTTLYVFNEGRPLWLAGITELSTEQQTLTVDLYQYDGLELFELDATPERTVFGQLQLELETCDQMKISINSDIYNQSMSLYRVDDTSYNHLCAQIEPILLEGPNSAALALGVENE